MTDLPASAERISVSGLELFAVPAVLDRVDTGARPSLRLHVVEDGGRAYWLVLGNPALALGAMRTLGLHSPEVADAEDLAGSGLYTLYSDFTDPDADGPFGIADADLTRSACFS